MCCIVHTCTRRSDYYRHKHTQAYTHLNWVAVGKGIQAHGTGILTAEEVGPDLIFWVGVVNQHTGFCSIQVANPSFSHKWVHHSIVT